MTVIWFLDFSYIIPTSSCGRVKAELSQWDWWSQGQESSCATTQFRVQSRTSLLIPPALVLCIIFTSCHLCLDLLFTGTQEVPSSAWKFGRGSRTLQKVLTLVSLLDRWTFIFTAQHFLQMYSCCTIANILFPILFYTQFLCLCHSLKCSGLWIATRERTELLWVILFLRKLSASH